MNTVEPTLYLERLSQDAVRFVNTYIKHAQQNSGTRLHEMTFREFQKSVGISGEPIERT